MYYPKPLNNNVSAVMKANKKTDTVPEKMIRSELHKRGYRFRKNYQIKDSEIHCHVDIVFPRRKIAIFVDGCFWHACPRHGNLPGHNQNYWQKKLERNKVRDQQNTYGLSNRGWKVIRIWEHEETETALSKITKALERKR